VYARTKSNDTRISVKHFIRAYKKSNPSEHGRAKVYARIKSETTCTSKQFFDWLDSWCSVVVRHALGQPCRVSARLELGQPRRD
jgi:hypothetical protein